MTTTSDPRERDTRQRRLERPGSPGTRPRARFALLLATAVLACRPAADAGADPPRGTAPTAPAAPSRLVVAAVNYPLAYFAERIGGTRVEVVFPLPSDVDPSAWRPSGDEVGLFAEADLILDNGAGYARWMLTAALPPSRIVDTSAAFGDRLIARPGGLNHSHGPEGEHAHSEIASTTWLDLELAGLQARAVRDALLELRPAAAAEWHAACDTLLAELAALDERLRAAAQQTPLPGVIFSHPVYDYLARRYGIAGPSLHWEPHIAPDGKAWSELEELALEHGATWLVWEAVPLPETARALRERGLESAVIAPCGNRPVAGDLLTSMAANVREFERLCARPR